MPEDQDLTAALHAARQRRKTLNDTLVHLEEALSSPAAGRIPGWTATVLKELYEVRDAFEQHILVTEQEDGLYDEILERAPRLAGNVRRLRDEHQRSARASRRTSTASSTRRLGPTAGRWIRPATTSSGSSGR